VTIDAELWSHFGSAEAVNDALRRVADDGGGLAGLSASDLELLFS